MSQKQQKHRLLLSIIVAYCFLIAWAACKSGGDTAATKADGTSAAAVTVPPNNLATPPANLSNLFSPNEGVLRGIDFRDNKEQISQKENEDNATKSTTNSLLYSVDLANTDFSDIRYEFDATKNLKKIEVDIFCKSTSAAKDYHKALTDFFDKKYKKRSQLWEGSEAGITYTIYSKLITDTGSSGVYIVWEKI